MGHREQNSSCPVTWDDEPRGCLTEWEATPLKPTEDAKMGNDEAERLIAAISSQIGDDVSVIFNHESLFKRSRDLIRTQAARIAELELRRVADAHFMNEQMKRAEAAEAALSEMTRRRDEWRKKAEGFDAVRLALREKVGTPWPANMSRLMWAGIAADEKKRADDAEAEVARLREAVSLTVRADNLREEYHKMPNDKNRIGDKRSRKGHARDAWLRAFRKAARVSRAALQPKEGF